MYNYFIKSILVSQELALIFVIMFDGCMDNPSPLPPTFVYTGTPHSSNMLILLSTSLNLPKEKLQNNY